jgi:lipopolysaccharide export system permease protein
MTLFTYVLKEYFRYVIGIVALCVFLFVLFDFMHQTTRDFAEYHASSLAIARYYLYQIPFQIIQALPIASLLASVISMALLSRGNEITVMRAVGMGPLAIGLPLLAGGGILSIVAFFGGEFLIPISAARMHYVFDVVIKGDSDDAVGKGANWIRDKDRFVNFREFDPKAGTLTSLKILEVDDNFRWKKVTKAKQAVYSAAQGNWKLTEVSIAEFGDDGLLHNEREADSALVFLPVEPNKLKKERRKPDELAANELSELIERGELSGKDVLSERMAFYTKWAYPLASLLVSLMGLRFGYRSERANETVKNVLLAFLTGLSYWFVLSAGHALGSRGDVSPLAAAWMANAFISCLIAYQVWSIRRA